MVNSCLRSEAAQMVGSVAQVETVQAGGGPKQDHAEYLDMRFPVHCHQMQT